MAHIVDDQTAVENRRLDPEGHIVEGRFDLILSAARNTAADNAIPEKIFCTVILLRVFQPAGRLAKHVGRYTGEKTEIGRYDRQDARRCEREKPRQNRPQYVISNAMEHDTLLLFSHSHIRFYIYVQRLKRMKGVNVV
jgi:hypothetical protein